MAILLSIPCWYCDNAPVVLRLRKQSLGIGSLLWKESQRDVPPRNYRNSPTTDRIENFRDCRFAPGVDDRRSAVIVNESGARTAGTDFAIGLLHPA